MTEQDAVVAKLDKARTALAEAKTIQDVKKISDIANAAEIYAKQQQLGDEAIGYAHAIKIEAMRRLGEMLKETPKRGPEHSTGGGSKGSRREPLPNAPPTLADFGLTKKVSMISQKLADLPKEQFDQVREGTSSVMKAIREVENAKKRDNAPPMIDGKYRVIYADPPWKYGDKMAISKDGVTENYGPADAHYPQMSIRELCDLPIIDIAMNDSVLFLWTTSPLLEESFQVIHAWGFQYKTSFVWDKVKHNMGHYNSVRHEFLLVCTRGSCHPDVKKLFDSVQTIERTDKHSEKPEEFRKINDTIYPHGDRIELYARGKTPTGWKSWGNES